MQPAQRHKTFVEVCDFQPGTMNRFSKEISKELN